MNGDGCKVALFCPIRNEHIYVKEYIDHYLGLGFDHIYFCDNSDNDKLDSICLPYKDHVSIIDIRAKDTMKNFPTYQATLFTSLYNIYSFKYDWLCFFDIDEILILHCHQTIQDYLECFKDVQQIHVSWVVFDDNNQLYYENKPMIERFTHVSQKYYDLYEEYGNGVKAILKTGLDLHFITPHTAISNTNTPLITVDNDHIMSDEFTSNHIDLFINIAQLNHYLTKSTEEYLNKNLGHHSPKEFIEKYFKVNEYSIEKENILNRFK